MVLQRGLGCCSPVLHAMMRRRTTCMLMKLAPSSIAAWNASSVSSIAPGPTSVKQGPGSGTAGYVLQQQMRHTSMFDFVHITAALTTPNLVACMLIPCNVNSMSEGN